jgi:hypothetical protein
VNLCSFFFVEKAEVFRIVLKEIASRSLLFVVVSFHCILFFCRVIKSLSDSPTNIFVSFFVVFRKIKNSNRRVYYMVLRGPGCIAEVRSVRSGTSAWSRDCSLFVVRESGQYVVGNQRVGRKDEYKRRPRESVKKGGIGEIPIPSHSD